MAANSNTQDILQNLEHVPLFLLNYIYQNETLRLFINFTMIVYINLECMM